MSGCLQRAWGGVIVGGGGREEVRISTLGRERAMVRITRGSSGGGSPDSLKVTPPGTDISNKCTFLCFATSVPSGLYTRHVL